MKHTGDDFKTAIEYAANLLEQLDAGGTLPNLLRQHVGKIEAAIKAKNEECEQLRAQLAGCKRPKGD